MSHRTVRCVKAPGRQRSDSKDWAFRAPALCSRLSVTRLDANDIAMKLHEFRKKKNKKNPHLCFRVGRNAVRRFSSLDEAVKNAASHAPEAIVFVQETTGKRGRFWTASDADTLFDHVQRHRAAGSAPFYEVMTEPKPLKLYFDLQWDPRSDDETADDKLKCFLSLLSVCRARHQSAFPTPRPHDFIVFRIYKI